MIKRERHARPEISGGAPFFCAIFLFDEHNRAVVKEVSIAVFLEDDLGVGYVDDRIKVVVDAYGFDDEWIGACAADVSVVAVRVAGHAVLDNLLRIEVLIAVDFFAGCSLDDRGHGRAETEPRAVDDDAGVGAALAVCDGRFLLEELQYFRQALS